MTVIVLKVIGKCVDHMCTSDGFTTALFLLSGTVFAVYNAKLQSSDWQFLTSFHRDTQFDKLNIFLYVHMFPSDLRYVSQINLELS